MNLIEVWYRVTIAYEHRGGLEYVVGSVLWSALLRRESERSVGAGAVISGNCGRLIRFINCRTGTVGEIAVTDCLIPVFRKYWTLR
jgi:hypothetical protein